jgi:hypothetical protein
MSNHFLVAEGQHVLEILKRLFVNGMLEHRVTNRLKLIVMEIQLLTKKPVALELKLLRDAMEPPTFYLEVYAYFQDGSGAVSADPHVITMTTGVTGWIITVDC